MNAAQQLDSRAARVAGNCVLPSSPIKSNFNFNDIKAKSEEDIFVKLGMPYVIPEMREQQYFNYAPELIINSNLALEKFQGLLHFHTTQSDGLNSLEQMVGAAEKIGFNYAAVCDHSKSAFYANGLKEDAVISQREIVNEINSRRGIKVFHGIESDILSDGSLDYPDEILSTFDFVVASIHSSFSLSEDDKFNKRKNKQ